MIKALFLTAITGCLFFTANAQTDTSHYDLGRISVKKDFTQSITIKGSDLERYQFSNLADAINVWLYGTYSNSSSIIYVVNGNIIADVNAYSIYDIEEVTLVQNALAQVSGASPGQQMVLIKLRTNRPGKQGIEAAGQTSLVNMRNQNNTPGVKSTTNLYDQYYLSGYKNFDNAHFGISTDYQHDVFPELKSDNFNSLNPFHFNRFKLNAQGDAKLWKGSAVTIGVNYVPQESSFSYNLNEQGLPLGQSQEQYGNDHITQHLFNSNIALTSHIVNRLTNTLSGAYSHYNYFENDSIGYFSSSFPITEFGTINDFNKISNILIRDNLVYHTRVGIFDIEPVLNFSYRNLHNTASDSTAIILRQADGTNNPSSFNGLTMAFNYKLYLLTPSLNIYYKDILNVQGGFVSILNSKKDFSANVPEPRVFPFLSASVDVAKLSGISNISLRIFGSFARQNVLLDDSYATLSGFSLAGIINATTPPSDINGIPNIAIYSGYNPYQVYNNYQAGMVLRLFKNFSINYSFVYRFNQDLTEVLIPFGPNGAESEITYFDDKTITNRIGLNYNYSSGNFTWRSGLNVAGSKLQVVNNSALAATYNASYLGAGHRYSGGFTNRFTYETFFAGFDILYQLGERPLSLMNTVFEGSNTNVAPGHINSISLQNLYAGTPIKITHLKYAEAFVNARNIIQNKTSDITDNRRFYGLGFKLGL